MNIELKPTRTAMKLTKDGYEIEIECWLNEKGVWQSDIWFQCTGANSPEAAVKFLEAPVREFLETLNPHLFEPSKTK